jgi:type I restriction enzyme S subunit
MAGEWVEQTIGELLADEGGSVKTGPFGTTLKAKEYSRNGVPLISVGEIGYGSLRVHEKTPRAPREVVERLPEYLLETGDIVFGRKGAVDHSALVKPEQAGWFLGSDGIRLRLPTTCDARFMAYQLQGQVSRSWLLQHATGTTMASLNQAIIERVPVLLPPLTEQRAIAHILGTLDDKIELNRRMSETLEAMARAIFKSWFVDFDPVRAKAEGRAPGLPQPLADLFPARLVDSDLGEIPEGWGVGRFGDAVEQLRDNVNPLASPGVDFRHFSIPAFDEGQWPKQELGESIKSQKSRVPPGVVLLSKLNPEIERVWLVDVQPEDRAVCSTEFLVLQPRPPSGRSYAYCLSRSPVFRQDIEGLVTGTSKSHQRAQVGSILGLTVVNPSDLPVQNFERAAEPLLKRTLACRRDSRTLAALRDTLLPKLIAGELRVKDTDRMVEFV